MVRDAVRRPFRVLLGVLAVAVASVLVYASSASAVTFTNACRNNAVATNWDQLDITWTATASPNPVAPGGAVTLSNNSQSAAVPGAVFVAGYNLGFLPAGPNTIPADVHSVIDATNTVEGSQTTNTVSGSISTTITDPNGIPGSGDETATPGAISVTYDDENWTADSDGGDIAFREHRDDAVNGVSGGGLVAVAHIPAPGGGSLNVQFHCTPGTVTGSNPGVPTFTDAPAFATTVGAPDTTPPDTTILSGPSGLTSDRTPTFTFSSTEGGSTFECKVDAASFASCSSPLTTQALSDGSHTFAVRATDASDNTDPTPATRSFAVDTTKPVAKIVAIKVRSAQRRAKIRFRGRDNLTAAGQLRFFCKLDRRRFRPCTSPKVYRKLKPGRHRFRLRAQDLAGNTSAVVKRSFRVGGR